MISPLCLPITWTPSVIESPLDPFLIHPEDRLFAHEMRTLAGYGKKKLPSSARVLLKSISVGKRGVMV